MIERFLKLLGEATGRIPEHYFQLPVAGKEDPIYRERVYCYELYHQLRTLLEGEHDFARYVLSGEIQKDGHPIIRPCMPDFVFHHPGWMDNLAVIEVKPVNAAVDGIRKDLNTLEYFLSELVGYKVGIELVYGYDEAAFSRFPGVLRGVEVKLFWHRCPGQPAMLIR